MMTIYCQEGRRLTFSKAHGPVFHHHCLRCGQGCSLLSAGVVLLQGFLPVTHLFQDQQLSQPSWTGVSPASQQTDNTTTYTCPCRLRSLLRSITAMYTVSEMRKVLTQESRAGRGGGRGGRGREAHGRDIIAASLAVCDCN